MSKDCIPNIYKDRIEEIIRNVYETGYDNGICDGNINNGTFNAKVIEAYNNGLNAAWECAKKIVLSKDDGGLDNKTFYEIFRVYSYYDAIKDNSAAEAIEKVKEYESHVPDTDVGEIKIGDEVTLYGQIGVVSEEPHKLGHNRQLFARVWFAVGSSSTIDVESLKKTGKHYSEIAEVLRQMKEPQNYLF